MVSYVVPVAVIVLHVTLCMTAVLLTSILGRF